MNDSKNIQEVIEMLSATVKCLRRCVSGINSECNSGNCDECDLCYAQGTTGEHIEALCTAISVLQSRSIEVQEAYYRGKADGIRECTAKLRKVTEVFKDDRKRNKSKN